MLLFLRTSIRHSLPSVRLPCAGLILSQPPPLPNVSNPAAAAYRPPCAVPQPQPQLTHCATSFSLSLLFLSLSPTARPVVFLRGPFLLALFFSPSLFAFLFHCHFFLTSELLIVGRVVHARLLIPAAMVRLVPFHPEWPVNRSVRSKLPGIVRVSPHCASSLRFVRLGSAPPGCGAALHCELAGLIACAVATPPPLTRLCCAPLGTTPTLAQCSHCQPRAVSVRCTPTHSVPLAHSHHGRSWCRHASRLCIALLHTAKPRQTVRR